MIQNSYFFNKNRLTQQNTTFKCIQYEKRISWQNRRKKNLKIKKSKKIFIQENNRIASNSFWQIDYAYIFIKQKLIKSCYDPIFLGTRCFLLVEEMLAAISN
ncbi:hypothetical protein BpHYR1_032383 [Brachionus plicatilis]|uniref:Uncharacterized protein n=1 Tax=Brachionus plicatilis TaxID=10195 RepID=A0A3M7SGY8_BRAPC|nr:hypothetical protein BpHYR1_032383 [Brachionus plicatilis]